jgi:hypothetical protein
MNVTSVTIWKKQTNNLASSIPRIEILFRTMPPVVNRNRDGPTSTTRCIMNMLSEDHQDTAASFILKAPSSAVDYWDRSHMMLLLQELQESLDNRLAILKSQASKAKDAQKQCWVNATVKIRKSIKEMSVQDFNAQYKCDLISLLTKSETTQRQSVYPMSSVASTPAPSKMTSKTELAIRTVKRGEEILYVSNVLSNMNSDTRFLLYISLLTCFLSSKQGSPVNILENGDLVATVAKKRRLREGEMPVHFDINVGDGNFISLSNPGNLKLLDDDLKNSAIQQLQLLQDQMASLMAQLQSD